MLHPSISPIESRAAGTMAEVHRLQKLLRDTKLSRRERERTLRTLSTIEWTARREIEQLHAMLRAAEELREEMAVHLNAATMILEACAESARTHTGELAATAASMLTL